MSETNEATTDAQARADRHGASRRWRVWLRRDGGEVGGGGPRHLVLPGDRWPGRRRGRQGDHQRGARGEAPVEAQNAADALGVQHPVIFLHYMDSRLEPTLDVRRDIARVIRQVKPDVVICQDPRALERPGLHQPS